MNPKQVLDLLEASGLSKGRVLYHQSMRRAGRDAGGPEQRRLLQDLKERELPTPKVVRHPVDEAVRNRYLRGSDGELTPVELAWLQRLPLNPEQVSFDDASRLAALSLSVPVTKFPASARLVESVWGPVKALHDKRVAEARLEHARQPIPQTPSCTQSALAEAIAVEHPGLHPEAAMAEARERLIVWAKGVQDKHDARLARAEADLAEVNQRIERAADTTGAVV